MNTSRIIALLTFFIAHTGFTQDAEKLRLALITCGDRQSDFLFEISKAKMGTLPKWHPESDSPAPVSLKRAYELGRTGLKNRYPDIDEFEVGMVRISEVISTERHGTWFYEVNYIGKRDGKPVGSCGLFAVILMDGTSVEPVVTRKNP